MSSTDRRGRHIALYVRSLRPRSGGQHQRAVLNRLAALTDGAVDGYSVTVWGRRLPAGPDDAWTDVGRRYAEQVTLFEAWARRNDRSIDAAFPVRTVDSAITGERTRARLVPGLALAEFHGQDLAFVAPVDAAVVRAVNSDRTDPAPDDPVSVIDRLDELAEGRPTAYVPVERALAAPPATVETRTEPPRR
jgi:hypothetical protein